MDKKKKVFIIIAVLFVLAVVALTIDMMRRTTSPWTKEKIEKKYKVK